MWRPLLLIGVAPISVLSATLDLTAQNHTCDLIDSRRVNSITREDRRISHVSSPRFFCTDGTQIEADSSITFEATSFTQFFGNVHIRDGIQELLAERAQYSSRTRHLQAQGLVSITDSENGSTITGDNLVMIKSRDDNTPNDMTIHGGRPRALLFSSTGSTPETTQPEPFDINANVIRLLGDHLFQARGSVEIQRNTLIAYSDSMEYQQKIGTLTLFKKARIISPDLESGDTLDVRGDTIHMLLPEDDIDELEARGYAHLITDDVDIKGPVLRVFFAQKELERIVSMLAENNQETERKLLHNLDTTNDNTFIIPQAKTEDFTLSGDSITVNNPNGEIETVSAIGKARGVSNARNSLNTDETPHIIRHDWIEGDTVTAIFNKNSNNVQELPPLIENDAPQGYTIDKLIAQGDARSFYRSDPNSNSVSENSEQCLEFNYVLGEEIRIFMKNGEVDHMEVKKAKGAYFQIQDNPVTSETDTTSSLFSDAISTCPEIRYPIEK